MNEHPGRSYTRWRDAEADGRDDEADALFGTVFRTASDSEPVPPRFAASTMEAVARAAALDARRAYRLRRFGIPAGVVCAVAVVYLIAGHVGALVSAIVVSSLDLLIALVVGITANGAGRDMWSVLSSLGRATAALLANPGFTAAVLAIQGLALVALVTLRRLLHSDEEYFR